MNLSIHPSVGVAGPGNCTAEICLSSDSIGRLPFNTDLNGNSSCSTVLKLMPDLSKAGDILSEFFIKTEQGSIVIPGILLLLNGPYIQKK